MANNIIYKTKEECLAAIETLKSIGMEPLPWQMEQLRFFEEDEKRRAVNPDSETPIWDTLKANYPYGVMPEDKIRCVEETVSQLLEKGPHADEPGLLLGKIQCGKTDTFEDIIGLSFDKGVDIAIVLTKGTKALVNQTIKRMKKDYHYFKKTDLISEKPTINIYDIMEVWKVLKQARIEGCKTVIVCKKNSVNLAHLIDLFEKNCPFLKQKKVIVVDDEADFASRNYRQVKLEAMNDEEGNPLPQEREIEMAKIAQQIDDFRKIPEFCRYLQVTATPYCLYLQPGGELNLNGKTVKPFKPRFTSLVPIHDRYIGGEEYFVKSKNSDSMYSHLYTPIDQKCIDVLGHENKRYLSTSIASKNIYGLTHALVAYFMATAIRRIQVRQSEYMDYKTSAIIHVEIDKKNHNWQCRMVNKLIESLSQVLMANDHSDQRIWQTIGKIYDDYQASNRKGLAEGLISINMPTKEEVIEEVTTILNPAMPNYSVQPVNSDEQMASLLDEDSGELMLEYAATIFIGGNILDRGVTIQHMLCFFYGRNPKNFQQDTVLQHARMYGARSKEDMAVMRMHTTPYIYKILSRMNELDDQLRQWFIEGKDKAEPNAVFVGYDKNIKPCASQKIKVSNALMLKPQHRVLPIGFWVEKRAETIDIVNEIERLITYTDTYQHRDEHGFFEMGSDRAMQILKLIGSTYVYRGDFNNMSRKNDIMEMMCALDYCTSRTGKVYALHRTDRNLSRIRENGNWIDSPDDGRTDLAPSRDIAQDVPVLMFIRENGSKQYDHETHINYGWDNTPFYWPVLLPQKNLGSVMFALDQSRRAQAKVLDISDFFEGIDPNDVLQLTYAGDMVGHFGPEGTEYADGEYERETRSIKDTTASRFLLRDECGNWAKNPSVTFDERHDYSVYSLNNGHFPFLLRPYKYMLLRDGRTAEANAMLLQLAPMDTWETISEPRINEEGDLLDRDSGKMLLHGTDIIRMKNMTEQEYREEAITQWIVIYKIKKVLKVRMFVEDVQTQEDVETTRNIQVVSQELIDVNKGTKPKKTREDKTKAKREGKKDIPIDYWLVNGDEEKLTNNISVSLSAKDIKNIAAFIRDGHATGELVDIPQKIYDKIFHAACDDLIENFPNYFQEDDLVELQKYLPTELVALLPQGVVEMLPEDVKYYF